MTDCPQIREMSTERRPTEENPFESFESTTRATALRDRYRPAEVSGCGKKVSDKVIKVDWLIIYDTQTLFAKRILMRKIIGDGSAQFSCEIIHDMIHHVSCYFEVD